MDELNNGEQGQYVEPGKNEKKNNTRKIVKRTLLTAGLALAVYMVYSIVYLFISPDRNIQQIYLVPEDAALLFSHLLRLKIGKSLVEAKLGNV
mgnify:CR=1 FL=1